jgi:hypothetical protein
MYMMPDLHIEEMKLAAFKKISESEKSKYKVLLQPIMRDDKTIAGRITSIGIGDCGSIDVKSTAPDDPNILDSFDQAASTAGADGIVGVYDPAELWAPEWPSLT